jgi:hypothetical protein
VLFDLDLGGLSGLGGPGSRCEGHGFPPHQGASLERIGRRSVHAVLRKKAVAAATRVGWL